MSNVIKPKYIAQTKEEFEELNKSIGMFLENYVLELNGVGSINVEKGALEKTVSIYPNMGSIKEIRLAFTEPKGILRTSNPEYTIVEIGGYQFMIRYTNLDKEKSSR